MPAANVRRLRTSTTRRRRRTSADGCHAFASARAFVHPIESCPNGNLKKLLPAACLLFSATLALARMPEETVRELQQAIQQKDSARPCNCCGTATPWAERGDAQAQNALGQMYDKGLGVAQSYAQARAWYEKAAMQRENAANAEAAVRQARQALERMRRGH